MILNENSYKWGVAVPRRNSFQTACLAAIWQFLQHVIFPFPTGELFFAHL